MQAQRQRIESAITVAIDDMDKTLLRKMQNKMHLCAAKCCQDGTSTADSVQRCVDRCSAPVIKAQKYVQHELEEFQGRLQRCAMQCQDDVNIEMTPNPNDDQIAKFQAKFDLCAIQCVDKHVGLIPGMMETMKAVLSKGSEGDGSIQS